jgi:hypothetical protein
VERRLELAIAPGEQAITKCLDASSDRPGERRAPIECLLAEIVHFGRVLTGTEIRTIEVCAFATAPQVRDTSAIRSLFCLVRFLAPRNES